MSRNHQVTSCRVSNHLRAALSGVVVAQGYARTQGMATPTMLPHPWFTCHFHRFLPPPPLAQLVLAGVGTCAQLYFSCVGRRPPQGRVPIRMVSRVDGVDGGGAGIESQRRVKIE